MGSGGPYREGNPVLGAFAKTRFTFLIGWCIFAVFYLLTFFITPHRWWSMILTTVLVICGSIAHLVAGQTWCRASDTKACAFKIETELRIWDISTFSGVLFGSMLLAVVLWVVMRVLGDRAKNIKIVRRLETINMFITLGLLVVLVIALAAIQA